MVVCCRLLPYHIVWCGYFCYDNVSFSAISILVSILFAPGLCFCCLIASGLFASPIQMIPISSVDLSLYVIGWFIGISCWYRSVLPLPILAGLSRVYMTQFETSQLNLQCNNINFCSVLVSSAEICCCWFLCSRLLFGVLCFGSFSKVRCVDHWKQCEYRLFSLSAFHVLLRYVVKPQIIYMVQTLGGTVLYNKASMFHLQHPTKDLHIIEGVHIGYLLLWAFARAVQFCSSHVLDVIRSWRVFEKLRVGLAQDFFETNEADVVVL